MQNISQNLHEVLTKIGNQSKLIAVTKTKPIPLLMEAYNYGFKRFGENKVQEMCTKYDQMPKDIEWHMIGHLQSNKVKYIAPFVSLIHAVDSMKLLKEINKEAKKNDRVINCLLQIHIADEDTKFGLSIEEATAILSSPSFETFSNLQVTGLMGMATNTEDESKIRKEFQTLKTYFEALMKLQKSNIHLTELSMGMSSDYQIAMEEGSTMVRVGSAIFGNR